MTKHVPYIVVGCGLSGAVIAERLASRLKRDVLIIDKRNHIAGNIYDYYDANGICIHKFGSHIFHTNTKQIWDYLKNFTVFNTYTHKVVAIVDGVETTIPFNLRSLYDVFPQTLGKSLEEKLITKFKYNSKVSIIEFQKQDDEDLKFLAEYIYEKIFLNYTIKQWGRNPSEMDSGITARVPVYISCDIRYFQDTYQGIPQQGYTTVVENMISDPRIKLELNKDFALIRDTVTYDNLFYTGSIDEYFEFNLGSLPYRSVKFELEEHDCEFYQSNAVINYPGNYDFTRIHEYKYYQRNQSRKTVIAKEYSEEFEDGKNDRYYPILTPESRCLYEKYHIEAKKLKNVHFLGRLGDYKYYNMDEAVERALNMVEELIGRQF